MKISPACTTWCLLIVVVSLCAAQDAHEEVEEDTTEKACPAECDLRQCAQVIADECDGQIIKDECDCCPVCEPTAEYEPYYEQEGAGDDTVMMIVNATHKEACSKIQCSRLQICSLNIQSIPRCRCPTQFFCRNHKMSRKDVCALDGQTYRSRCFLRMKECNENQRIGIKHRGPCFKGDRLARKRQRQQKKKDRVVGGRGLKKDGRKNGDDFKENKRNRFEGQVNKGKRNRNKMVNNEDYGGKRRSKIDRGERKGGRDERRREDKKERKAARREEKRKERLEKKREQRLKEDRDKKRNRRRKLKRKERRAARGKRSCPEEESLN